MTPIPTSDLPGLIQPPTDRLTVPDGDGLTVMVRTGCVIVAYDGAWGTHEAIVLTDGDGALPSLNPVQRAVIVARLRAQADRLEQGRQA